MIRLADSAAALFPYLGERPPCGVVLESAARQGDPLMALVEGDDSARLAGVFAVRGETCTAAVDTAAAAQAVIDYLSFIGFHGLLHLPAGAVPPGIAAARECAVFRAPAAIGGEASAPRHTEMRASAPAAAEGETPVPEWMNSATFALGSDAGFPLIRQAFPHLCVTAEQYGAEVAARAAGGTGLTLTAELGGAPVAVAALWHLTPTAGVLTGVAVAESARGQGLGRAVVRRLLREAGGRAVFAESESPRADAFYRVLGFTPCGRCALLRL